MDEIEVLSRTQRVIVEQKVPHVILDSTRHIKIYNRGTVGPRGYTGPSGAATNVAYRHNQDLPLIVWLVVHNLGYTPAGVQAYELVAPDEYVEVDGTIVHLNDNMFTIQYDVAISGYAIVS